METRTERELMARCQQLEEDLASEKMHRRGAENLALKLRAELAAVREALDAPPGWMRLVDWASVVLDKVVVLRAANASLRAEVARYRESYCARAVIVDIDRGQLAAIRKGTAWSGLGSA
jgi:hypothetical protein